MNTPARHEYGDGSNPYEREELCEGCGEKIGVHPFPIGGGWAKACDDCRKESEAAAEKNAGIEFDEIEDGIRPVTWDEWAREAREGPPPRVRVITSWTVSDVAESLRDEFGEWLEKDDHGRYEDGTPTCMTGECGGLQGDGQENTPCHFIAETNGGKFKITVERAT